MRKQNILVTGGSGFIGSHIVDKLAEFGHHVRILDLKPPHRADIEFIKGDFLSENDLRKAIRGTDIVYHIGAFSNIDLVRANPVETVKLNILGTAKILDAARKNRIKRFLFASSVYVNDKQGHIYTTAKISSEMLCKDFFTLYGLPYTILRFGTAYGPRSRGVDVISSFVRDAIHKNRIFIHGAGTQERNFIYTDDLALASVGALKKIGENKTYVIASLRTISIRELAYIIKKKFNDRPKILRLRGRERFDDYRGKMGGVRQTMKELGWEPRYSLEQGIDEYLKWHQSFKKI